MIEEKLKLGFYISKEEAWAYHIGIHLCFQGFEKEYNKPICVEPTPKDMYLFLCFGKIDISIGYRWIPKKRLLAYVNKNEEEEF